MLKEFQTEYHKIWAITAITIWLWVSFLLMNCVKIYMSWELKDIDIFILILLKLQQEIIVHYKNWTGKKERAKLHLILI